MRWPPPKFIELATRETALDQGTPVFFRLLLPRNPMDVITDALRLIHPWCLAGTDVI